MSLTNTAFIREALGLIGVLGEVQAASAEQIQHGMRVNNRLFASWMADGIDVQYFDQDTPGDTIPIPDSALDAALYFSSFKLAPYYGKQVSPEMIAEGDRLYSSLVRRTVIDEVAPATNTLPRGEGDLWLVGSNILTG